MNKYLLASLPIIFSLAFPGTVFAEDDDDFENDDVATSYVDENGVTHFRSAEQVQELEYSQDTHEEDERRREESEARINNWASTVNFGVRGTVGLNYLTGSDASKWGWKTGFTFGAGGVLAISLNEMFQIVPEASINYRRNSYKNEGDVWSGDLSAWTLDVPLLFRVNILSSFFATIGPEFAFTLSSSDSYDFGVNSGNDLITPASLEVGLALGGGYYLDNDMLLDLRVFKSFTDYAKKTKIYNSYKGFSTLQISAGFTYMF